MAFKFGKRSDECTSGRTVVVASKAEAGGKVLKRMTANGMRFTIIDRDVHEKAAAKAAKTLRRAWYASR